ncbi:MAG: YihY/virulence factor BrkB family protein [Dehalococcoidia bacterium]|nr:YihY/virulence factor BrkB family protein [Dehalococcoidia bacterium]
MKLGRIGRQVRTLVIGSAQGDQRRNGLWNDRVRAASQLALGNSTGDGRRAGQVAREAVRGAIGALAEIGGEASGIARDAVMGVVQGTSGSSKPATPLIREAVEGAIRGSLEMGVDIQTAGTDAVEGAIEGAVFVGVETDRAVSEASYSAFEAITGVGVDVGSAAKAAIVGVITSVSATGGNVPQAARDTAKLLIDNVSGDSAQLAYVAQSVVEGALEVQNVDHVFTVSYVGRAAEGAIDGAYDVSEEVGDEVRLAIAGMLENPRVHVGPATAPLLQSLAERVAVYHPQGPLAWRIKALWYAGWSLARTGGIDLAASLAFFTLLSFFPLVALVILIFSAFADPETIETELAHVFLFFFPASGDFFNNSVGYLFSSRVAASIVAIVGIVIGANGLFMAANRSVNRIFGTEPRRLVTTTLLQVVLTIGIMLLFLTSIGLTLVFQIALSISSALPLVSWPVNRAVLLVTELISGVLPIFMTMLAFGIVYRALPNTHVPWRDATFGAIIAVVLFEVGKHIFFWFGNITGQQNLIYLPFSSVILLLIWAFIGGIIFLFGASITNEAASNRPKGIEGTREASSPEREDEGRSESFHATRFR